MVLQYWTLLLELWWETDLILRGWYTSINVVERGGFVGHRRSRLKSQAPLSVGL